MLSRPDFMLTLAVHLDSNNNKIRHVCRDLKKRTHARYHPTLDGILKAQSPNKALKVIFAEIERIEQTVAGFEAEGFDGMTCLKTGEEIPFHVPVENDEQLREFIAREHEINYAATAKVFIDLGVAHARFETVLFGKAGYSGKLYRWELMRKEDGSVMPIKSNNW